MASNDRKNREERARLRNYQARQEVHARKVRRRVRDNIAFGIGAVVVVALAVGAQVAYFNSHKPKTSPSASASAEPTATPSATAEGKNEGPVPSAELAENREWTGTLTINNVPLGVTFDGKAAPQAVSSTVSLEQKGFYNNLTCHRLTTSGIFVLQCGDPKGDGTGGPGYSYGPVENAPADGDYPTGTIAMARSSSQYSNGSQFFIVYADTKLPTDGGGYSIIGKVTSGLDELKTAVIDPGTTDGSGDGKPKVTTTINSFTLQ